MAIKQHLCKQTMVLVTRKIKLTLRSCKLPTNLNHTVCCKMNQFTSVLVRTSSSNNNHNDNEFAVSRIESEDLDTEIPPSLPLVGNNKAPKRIPYRLGAKCEVILNAKGGADGKSCMKDSSEAMARLDGVTGVLGTNFNKNLRLYNGKQMCDYLITTYFANQNRCSGEGWAWILERLKSMLL